MSYNNKDIIRKILRYINRKSIKNERRLIMGYKIINRYRRKCYCGKGEIEIITEMDDWNRSRSSENFYCPICEDKHNLKQEKLVSENNRRNELSKEVNDYFFETYFSKWDAFLNGFNNKKEKYKFLNENGILESIAESTFCQKYKKNDISREVVNSKSIPKILKLLNISDEEYSKKIDELLDLENKEHNRAIRAYHKGY